MLAECEPYYYIKNAENVFSGPFVISERTNDTIILKKNSNYYDAEHVNLKQITLKFSNDELENTYNYNIGTVDWLCSTFNNEKLLSKDSLQLYAEFATQYYFFKIRKESICSNLTLRQALLPQHLHLIAVIFKAQQHLTLLLYQLDLLAFS